MLSIMLQNKNAMGLEENNYVTTGNIYKKIGAHENGAPILFKGTKFYLPSRALSLSSIPSV